VRDCHVVLKTELLAMTSLMQKKLILFLIILFILSSAYLLTVGNKFNNLNFGKNWWAVYFENPKDNSLNFVIENHSDKTNFHWTILADKEKIKEGDIKINNGELPRLNLGSDFANKKITIEVSSGDEKKEIYKNF